MRVSTMRAIDRFAGVPLCWLLGIGLRLREALRPGKLPAEPRAVLFIKFFGLGSIVLSMPAVAAFRLRFAGARISYLTFAPHAAILERYDCIDDVLVIDPATPRSFVASTLRALSRLRRVPYDIVIDFEFFSKFSTLLSTLTGAPGRSGFLLPALWRRLHLTHAVPLSKTEHVTEAFGRQVSAFTGVPAGAQLIPPAISGADDDALHAKTPLNGTPLAVFHVGAGPTFLERRWPPDRFAALIRSTVNGAGTEVCLTGTAEERSYVDAVIGLSGCRPHCTNLAGLLTLPELAALLRAAEVVVSNDSGPLHLAAALGTRVIGLFGPESPSFYGPLGENATAVYRPPACSPCMNVYAAKDYRCPYHARCMEQIEVADVDRLLAPVEAP